MEAARTAPVRASPAQLVLLFPRFVNTPKGCVTSPGRRKGIKSGPPPHYLAIKKLHVSRFFSLYASFLVFACITDRLSLVKPQVERFCFFDGCLCYFFRFSTVPIAPLSQGENDPAKRSKLRMTTMVKYRCFRTCIGLLGIMCLFTACAANSSGNASAPTTAADIIARANAAALHDAAFHFSLTQFRFSGTGVVTTQPHRVAFTLDPLNGATDSQQEVIDSTSIYIKSPGASAWSTVSNDPASGILGNPDLPNYAELQDVTLRGSETIDGVATWHLQAKVPSAIKTTTQTQEIWIRQDSFFPEQIIAHIASTGGAFVGAYDTKINFTTWNAGVTIALPTKVVSTATPSPTPPPGPFSGQPTYTNPLTADLHDGWSTLHNQYESCQFASDGYHLQTALTYGGFCENPRLYGTNFALQVQMTFLQGSLSDEGGVNFRGVGVDGDASYQFGVNADGRYFLAWCAASNCSHVLAAGVATNFNQGLHKANLLGVVAQGTSLAIYLNHHLLQKVTDSHFQHGSVALTSGPNNDQIPNEVLYQDFQEWIY